MATKVGEALRKARLDAGILQIDLARVLGISSAMVNHIERNDRIKLPDRLYAKLPDAIRHQVVLAAIAELHARELELRPLLKTRRQPKR